MVPGKKTSDLAVSCWSPRAGMVPDERAPRLRRMRLVPAPPASASWPPPVPARAGMVPGGPAKSCGTSAGPRARGDGPRAVISVTWANIWSPRARGWSPRTGPLDPATRLVPARAGMVPWRPTLRPVPSAGPRARGDGPQAEALALAVRAWSPRARGWSHGCAPVCGSPRLVPARAGMVPSMRSRVISAWSGPRARGDGPGPGRHLTSGPGWSPRAGMAPAKAA